MLPFQTVNKGKTEPNLISPACFLLNFVLLLNSNQVDKKKNYYFGDVPKIFGITEQRRIKGKKMLTSFITVNTILLVITGHYCAGQ